jgi:heterodisulfide reductase subunit A2
MNKRVAIIGGGPSGLECAASLVKMGFSTMLFDREKETGGHLRQWNELFPDRRSSAEVLQLLRGNFKGDGIELHPDTTVERIEKAENNFTVYTQGKESYKADAVVLATGFDLFNAARKEEYGYGIYENVITSADLERMFASPGGVVTHQGIIPRRIGFVHCVGSRDEKIGNLYCSKVCCITAVKQAIEIRQLLPQCETTCFYMDLRMYGRHFEELYNEAQEKWNVNFIRGRLSEAAENQDGSVIVKVEDTLTGRPLKMNVDLLVLMAGMVPSVYVPQITTPKPLAFGEDGFMLAPDSLLGSNKSGTAGLFFAGTCTGPKSIAETLADARSAALEVADFLKEPKQEPAL